ncbi:MAG: LuxR C-terminal-related transcriptional regulator [Mahellales bacterium]|jgi:DNA-binding NarL/FixJ family response regulator
MERMRIILAHKCKIVIEGLKSIFNGDNFEIIGQAYVERDVMTMARTLKPDVIVVNPGLSSSDNGEFIKRLKQAGESAKVVVMTDTDDYDFICECMGYGADGFIFEDGDIENNKIRDMVRLLYKQDVVCMPKPVFTHLVDLSRNRKLNGTGPVKLLSPREREVYMLMAKNYSNHEIGKALYISEATVKSHVSSILRKLKQPSRSKAVLYGFQTGVFNLRTINKTEVL